MDGYTIIGFIASGLLTGSFVPQVVHTYKTKNVEAISLMTYVVYFLGIILWEVYNIKIDSLPIHIANVFGFSLSLSMIIMKINYSKNKNKIQMENKYKIISKSFRDRFNGTIDTSYYVMKWSRRWYQFNKQWNHVRFWSMVSYHNVCYDSVKETRKYIEDLNKSVPKNQVIETIEY